MHIRHLVVAAVASMALAGTAAAAFSSSINNVIVSPGARVCLSPGYAASSVDAQGSASPGARFTVHYAPTQNGVYSTIYDSVAEKTAGFHATFSTAAHTMPGPGWFKVCGRAPSASSATVSLSGSGY